MFKTERELVNTIKSNYLEICDWDIRRDSIHVLEEVDLGFGIADLVITRINSFSNEKRSSLSYFDLTIYKIIEHNNIISLKQIEEITKSDSKTIKKSLDKLIVECYINQNDFLYKFSNSYEKILKNTIAIEAKLKNWQRAIEQAYRYKWFANIVYVVLDKKFINSASKNLKHFNKMNIGLASIDLDGHLEILHKPFAEKPIDIKMEMLLCEKIMDNLS